jgi:uncharacterized protein (TIGR00255 family)
MRSMTGYGAGSADAPAARVSVEIRGTNQRFLDLRVNTPREYAAWESQVRDRVHAAVARGRVEVTIVRTPVPARRRYQVAVRHDLARAYVAAARGLGRTLGLSGTIALADVLRLPDLLEVTERAPEVARERAAVIRALGRALVAFDAERRREGAHLRGDMRGRVAMLRRTVARVRGRVPAIARAVRRQALERLQRLAADLALDPGRLTHEAALAAERGDVTEELVRLASHLAALASVLGARGAIGKRIEFLLQEVHRELNTTGAKTNDLTVTSLLLEAKGQVEKLREQVQNVE